MPRMRTIQGAYDAILEADSESAITPYAIRRLILNNEIPYLRAGNKYLVDLDTLEEYLKSPNSNSSETPNNYGIIRPVKERRCL